MSNTDDDQLALDNQLGFTLTVVARKIANQYSEALAPVGLTPPQFFALAKLWEHELEVEAAEAAAAEKDADSKPAKGKKSKKTEATKKRASLSLSNLSKELSQEAGTLSPLIKRLEQQGLLTRTRLPEDERTLSITLTDRGRAMRKETEGIPVEIAEKLNMTAREFETLRKQITNLNSRLA
ncbi:MarR family transcriptional regulator [Lysinibacter sp. HNR]|uniref:MarR family winged helix-turn-helix transcriptional regulator n=1 Tax=Lysinibacter sp. HNR TaxID=3031408 RepID=UPI002435A062|nr:MarR family transcriptional regulator [Lysinibacter sp. HNR]WGD38154.1 MarR family transcriptional regulator [Lysinibacter sp. HNR]